MTTKPKRQSMFEIEAEFKMLADQIEQASEDGVEPPPEAMQAVRAALLKAEEKRDSFAGFVQTVRAYGEHCRAEAERQRKKALAAENLVERLHNYALDVMRAMDITRLSGMQARFVRVKNSAPSLFMLDESAVPERFWVTETTRKLDRKALAEAIESGEVPGSVAMLVHGEHLRIS